MTDIIKATGEREQFNKDKFCDSIKRAGAPEDVANEVCTLVEKKLKPGMTTSQIFRAALQPLIREDLETAARYSLRRGIASLGPAGFLFERYVEAILRSHGYATRRNVMLEGHCVDHEIDVLGEKGETHYLVEAKYRNQPGIKTHLNVVMYAHARLLDIAERRNREESGDFEHRMWIVTNTKFTTKAIRYGTCRGLSLTGWNYPKEGNLESLITEKNLFPITVLPSVTQYARGQFAKHDMILAQDLVPYTEHDLVEQFAIPNTVAKSIVAEVAEITN